MGRILFVWVFLHPCASIPYLAIGIIRSYPENRYLLKERSRATTSIAFPSFGKALIILTLMRSAIKIKNQPKGWR